MRDFIDNDGDYIGTAQDVFYVLSQTLFYNIEEPFKSICNDVKNDINSEEELSAKHERKIRTAIQEAIDKKKGKTSPDTSDEDLEDINAVNRQVLYEAAAWNFTGLRNGDLTDLSAPPTRANKIEEAAASSRAYHHEVLDLSNVV